MMAVPREPKRAADEAAETPANGALAPSEEPLSAREHNGVDNHAETDLVPVKAIAAPRLAPDPGLYATLGLDPAVPDAAIQTAYRRRAAKLLKSGATNTHAMRELNVAYEVLGNPARRVEYDRQRLSQALSPGSPTPVRQGAKADTHIRRRTRPRHVVQPRYAGLGDVMVVLMVVGVAVLAGVLIIPRLSINLSALNALQNVLPLSNNARRVVDAAVTPAPATPTPVPVPTPRPAVSASFAGSTATVSNPTPAVNSVENILIKLRRNGQPAANLDVWATVKYYTTEERWPATGTIKTDASGAATITFNIGSAMPNNEVQVRVFAQVDDQQLSWPTSFTPR